LKILSLRTVRTTLDAAQFPNSPWVEIAVAGRSNVGKSSLLNTLLDRRNFARTSKDPGKTRTINFYSVNDRFFLVDLPGYGYARISAEQRDSCVKVIYAYLETRQSLAGIVQLIDARHEPSREDERMIERLVTGRRQFIIVFTKADKIPRADRFRMVQQFNGSLAGIARIAQSASGCAGGPADSGSNGGIEVPAIFFSSKTGEGKDDLWCWIAERI
jgi:GTP-binding protein